MPDNVVLSSLVVVLSGLYLTKTKQRTDVNQTIFGCVMPLALGMLAWNAGIGWRASTNVAGGGYPYSVECVCWAAATVIMLVALGRRLVWLWHCRHTR